MNFQSRSKKKELLDDPSIPFADILLNMRELDLVNTWLGGHAISIKGIQLIMSSCKHPAGKAWTICEIGCGGADNIEYISAWCLKRKLQVSFTGIDVNPHCIAVAKSKRIFHPARFIVSDYKEAIFDDPPDIIFSSLFCHHFTDEQLVFMLQWMRIKCSEGFFINDLHRHPLAYYSIKLIALLFSGSYLLKNDAPLSVLRGFKKNEWVNLLGRAGISQFRIRWKWAFRWLVISSNLCSGNNTKTILA